MRKFLTTTALVAMTALPVYAESHQQTESVDLAGISIQQGDFTVADMVGTPVFIDPAGEVSETETGLDVPDSWVEIGQIDDVYLSADRQVATVLIAPGAALSGDQSQIGIDPGQLTFRRAGGDGTPVALYLGDMTSLETAEPFDREGAEAEGQVSASDSEMAAKGAAEPEAMSREETETVEEVAEPNEAAEMAGSAEPDTDPDTVAAPLGTNGPALDTGPLTAEKLDGMRVIGSDGDHVGEISQIILSEDGMVERVIVDVGGFLGIGEKPVALPFEDIELVEGDILDLREVRVRYTEEELEGMERWTE
ncbi:PRC-barrel domain-containing protein [Tropicimonas sediminicola]|uniref:Sporulation protein YlmC, PRC-barrel domain family n=1 Tax=Tropicimonas sediminicola TaxID=1031541 RepID=A0A239M053_9RHOB|nr:PRC-barrel domain-containing protein [Tropicimonas sediminicola]SNT35508.1 Sporulation protein YlmC, PRC-barrel domain family [Tropicimonas sediminicola]